MSCVPDPPEPYALWEKASKEKPGNASARGFRYRELMITHGLLVRKEDGRLEQTRDDHSATGGES